MGSLVQWLTIIKHDQYLDMEIIGPSLEKQRPHRTFKIKFAGNVENSMVCGAVKYLPRGASEIGWLSQNGYNFSFAA